MPAPSHAQAKILERMRAGARIALDPKTGRYTITERGAVLALDQRPILCMLRDGLLFQDMAGQCRESF